MKSSWPSTACSRNLALSKQNFALRRDAASHNSLDNIIGSSSAMEKLKQTARTVASTASTVLIHGESGTGKELVARAVHICSPRATEPFVSVNCGAFPETLLESELFGYLEGSFHRGQSEQARTVSKSPAAAPSSLTKSAR